MEGKKVELLAPAGNYEGFLGAINAGADAVYLGGTQFGARAYADNFTEEEILKAIAYAHLFDRKVYLTVNTLLKDEELEELPAYLRLLYNAGLDGVIVQDMGVFLCIRENFPHLALHVSTQMTLTGEYGVKMLKTLGAVRVVPARELSLAEIIEIKQNTDIEIEAFIHGAMCYCYSGQCLFSSILGGRSGNRGRCAQPCRLPYRIGKNHSIAGKTEEKYPLSLKDLCTIDLLPDLIAAGIDSFKIEGRMKKPEYAAGVTAIYRKYLDRYEVCGAEGYVVEEADKKELASLYIRSQTQDGYYFRQNGPEMLTFDSPAYSGSDEVLLSNIRSRYLETSLKKEISIEAVFCHDISAKLSLSCEGVTVFAEGEIPQPARKQPITRENLENGLLKLGNTPFLVNSHKITLEDGLFYPLKAIGELRRKGVKALEEAMLEEKDHRRMTEVKQDLPERRPTPIKETTPAFRILVSTKEQLQAILNTAFPLSVLYLESALFETSPVFAAEIKEKLKRNHPEAYLFLALPHILRQNKQKDFIKLYDLTAVFDGCLVRNMEELAYLLQQNYTGHLTADASLYCFNKMGADWLLGQVDHCLLPHELNGKEKRALLKKLPPHRMEQMIYGRLPLMLTANCIAKTAGHCKESAKADLFISDRYYKRFPISCHCGYCYNVIYNSVPLSLHKQYKAYENKTALRMDFTVENKMETEEVLQFFTKYRDGENPPYEYTAGHEKRGVL